jgi:hypothetical protein
MSIAPATTERSVLLLRRLFCFEPFAEICVLLLEGLQLREDGLGVATAAAAAHTRLVGRLLLAGVVLAGLAGRLLLAFTRVMTENCWAKE